MVRATMILLCFLLLAAAAGRYKAEVSVRDAKEELKALEKARGDFARNKDGKSLVGLDAPLFPLKNPAILSVPVGFLAAIAGTFLFGSRREEEMFDELYIRQNTGYGIADATDH